jgi:adenine-specific DNA-methyltransferase
MANIEITKTELVWPGKYNEDGTRKEVPRVNLPFQVIETINESRADREAAKNEKQFGLFNVYEGKEGNTFEEGWKNKLIWGDNLLVMSSLLEKFAGKIDLIYIDPPFATGADFSFNAMIGDSGEELFKEQSIIEEKAYRDTWGQGIQSYTSMICDRIILARELLSDHGSIFIHCDWHVSHIIRCLLEEIFGSQNFRNNLTWNYRKFGRAGGFYPRSHDDIIFYSKTEQLFFEPQYVQPSESTLKRWGNKKRGGKDPNFRYATDEDSQGAVMPDHWEINLIIGANPERVDFPTQKPEEIARRIIKGSAKQGSIVADLFCGSGTTLSVAEKLGYRWIGCDLGRYAIHVTRKRLLGIEGCKPFEILNLGKYERQYWQGVTFGQKEKTITERALYEYLAFVLKLYDSQPVAGLTHLHGKKDKALVHIGAVDAPVTIDEVNAAIQECLQLKQKELHILGWEWEMGLSNLMVSEAKKRGVKLLLLQIPREVMEQQAVDKGDIQFFELAYLEVEIQPLKKRAIKIQLKNFVISNTELIPEGVRSKIKKWSDFIDYWAVDWDFRNDTFMQGWVTYRTRKDRTLALTSDSHACEKQGTYRVLVKVIDIFGNDTSQVFEVEVK